MGLEGCRVIRPTDSSDWQKVSRFNIGNIDIFIVFIYMGVDFLLFQLKTQPVQLGIAMFTDSFTVICGSITFVFFPVVMEIFFVMFIHEIIAESFGQDTCSCNGGIDAITFDDRGMGNVVV